jgi:hypothetical protein
MSECPGMRGRRNVRMILLEGRKLNMNKETCAMDKRW